VIEDVVAGDPTSWSGTGDLVRVQTVIRDQTAHHR
jgi:hypothetical protein